MSAERGDVEVIPPVSYEALAENNRHTHANLNFCIQERDRLAASLERAERERDEAWRAHELAMKAGLARGARAEKAERALGEMREAVQRHVDPSAVSHERHSHDELRVALRPSEEASDEHI